jgi:hypothetical protein
LSNTRKEYSKIGKGTPDFSRINNVIGNVNHAATVEMNSDVVKLTFNTRSGKNVVHSITYEIDKVNLTDKQLEKVEARACDPV